MYAHTMFHLAALHTKIPRIGRDMDRISEGVFDGFGPRT